MSGPVRQRIICSLNCIDRIVGENIPQLGAQMSIPEMEQIAQRVKRKADDLQRHTDEIRKALDIWSTLITKMTAAERPAEEGNCNTFMQQNTVQNRLMAGEQRYGELRDREIDVNGQIAIARAALPPPAAPQIVVPQNRGVNFPLFKLKVFKGGREGPSWTEWWELFRSSVHEDTSLAPARKLAYLKDKMEGEAKEVLDGIEISEANYNVAIDLLKATYGSNEAIIRSLHFELISLKPSKNFGEDCKLRLTLEKVCRQLTNLGQDIEAPSIWIAVQQKLTKGVLREVLDIKATQLAANPAAVWNTTTLRDALKKVIAREQAVHDMHATERKSAAEKETKSKTSGEKRESSAINFATTTKKTGEEKGSKSPKTGKGKPTCSFCGKDHYSDKCDKFKTLEQRTEVVREKKLCFKCLLPGHSAANCKKGWKCFHCKKTSHHTAFCRNQFNKTTKTAATISDEQEESQDNEEEEEVAEGEESTHVTVTTTMPMRENNEKTEKTTLMFCAEVEVFNPALPKESCRILAFIDSGSEKTYLSENVAINLGLKPIGEKEFVMTGYGGEKLCDFRGHIVNVGVKGKGLNEIMEVNTSRKKIMGKLRHIPIDDIDEKELKKYKIAHSIIKKREPEMLIGSDYYNLLNIRREKQLPSGFWISNSTVGRIVSGRGKVKKGARFKVECCPLMMMNFEENLNEHEKLNRLVKKQYGLEMIGLGGDIDEEKEENDLIKEFESKISFNGDRYVVELPWNENKFLLPSNYGLAEGRLRSLLKRLREKPTILKLYHETILDHLKRGIIEKVESSEKPQVEHYLAHREVYKEDKETTKLRIVYDGSAKIRKGAKCLNDCLLKGPKLLNELVGIMIRMRLKKVILSADIEKAFLNIEIAMKDRDALRFLWSENPFNENSPIVVYRFARMAFGLISSPAQLAVVLNHHFDKDATALAQELRRDIYVDNIIKGLDKAEEIPQSYREMKKLFCEAGMNLREFVSNEKLVWVPECDRGSIQNTKLLGTKWDITTDSLVYSLPKFDEKKKVTRNTMLSQINKPYDVLGMISPAILKEKLFLQQLNKKGLEWDKEVEEKEAIEWRKLMEEWNGKQIEFERKYSENIANSTLEVHSFADASKLAMGIAIYVRIHDGSKGKCTLAMARSLVIPANFSDKQRTIPRLELQAAKIATELTKYVKNQLEMTGKVSRVILWTDSMDVVDWLRSSSQLPRPIQSRIEKIREFEVRHIKGEENPADIASRGTSLAELGLSKLWREGPPWLAAAEKEWPKPARIYNPKEERPEKESGPAMSISMSLMEEQEKKIEIDTVIAINKFSCWTKARRAMARIFQVADRFKSYKNSEKKERINIKNFHLNQKELKRGSEFLIQKAQEKYGIDENTKRNLDIVVDSGGLMRCSTRIQNSDLAWESKNPIYLPRKSEVTKLIIRETHIECRHAGIEIMVAKLRERYWIPQCRRVLNTVLFVDKETKCVECVKYRAKSYAEQKPPPLPKERVSAFRPFQNVGVDLFGPILIKDGTKSGKKVWGCIFVCMVCRAAHLELVKGMSAEEFLRAFRRFTLRKGVPSIIVSDNGTNFKAAAKIINEIWSVQTHQIFESNEIQNYAAKNGIEWKFNVERASWRGGFFERIIGTIKGPLRRTIGSKRLSEDELDTLFTEIEGIVNGRPLSFVSEKEICKIIRPVDFLIPYPKAEIGSEKPLEVYDSSDPDYKPKKKKIRDTLMENYRKASEFAEKFWKEWITEYLLALKERFCATKNEKGKEPKVGDFVIIHDDELNRSMWKTGVVKELIASRDGIIRTLKVNCGKNVITRATKHVYPLEIDMNDKEEEKLHNIEQNKTKNKKINLKIFEEEEDEDSEVVIHAFIGTMDEEAILNIGEGGEVEQNMVVDESILDETDGTEKVSEETIGSAPKERSSSSIETSPRAKRGGERSISPVAKKKPVEDNDSVKSSSTRSTVINKTKSQGSNSTDSQEKETLDRIEFYNGAKMSFNWQLLESCNGSGNHNGCGVLTINHVIETSNRCEETKEMVKRRIGNLVVTSLAQLITCFGIFELMKESMREIAIKFAEKVVKSDDLDVGDIYEKANEKIETRNKREGIVDLWTQDLIPLVELWKEKCVAAKQEFETDGAINLRIESIPTFTKDLIRRWNLAVNKSRAMSNYPAASFIQTQVMFVGDEAATMLGLNWGKSYSRNIDVTELESLFPAQCYLAECVEAVVVWFADPAVRGKTFKRFIKDLMTFIHSIRKKVYIFPPIKNSSKYDFERNMDVLSELDSEIRGKEIDKNVRFFLDVKTGRNNQPDQSAIDSAIEQLMQAKVYREDHSNKRKAENVKQIATSSIHRPSNNDTPSTSSAGNQSLDQRLQIFRRDRVPHPETLYPIAERLGEPMIYMNPTQKAYQEGLIDGLLYAESKRLSKSVEEVRSAMNICDKIQNWLRQDGFTYATANMVGSIYTGLSFIESDIDVTITVNKHDSVHRDGALSQIRTMKKKLEKYKEVEDAQYIDAKVPLLKLSINNNDIDLTFQNGYGIRNCVLIRDYLEFDHKLRPFYCFIRQWTIETNIGSSLNRTLNSLSTAILCIHIMQTERITPMLQLEFKERYSMRKPFFIMRSEAEKFPIKELVRNKPRMAEIMEQSKGIRIVHLIKKFFDYYSQLDYNKWAICLSDGRASKRSIDPLQINDPFDEDNNIARAVNYEGLKKIKEEFRKADRLIKEKSIAALMPKLFGAIVLLQILGVGCGQMVCPPMAPVQAVQIGGSHACSIFEQGNEQYSRISPYIYRYDEDLYSFKAYKCQKIQKRIMYRTDLANYPFSFDNSTSLPITVEECVRMRKLAECDKGRLVNEGKGIKHTNNKPEVNFSWFKFGWQEALADNCFVHELSLQGRPGKSSVISAVEEVDHCQIEDSQCILEDGSIIIWEYKNFRKQNCEWKVIDRIPGLCGDDLFFSEDGQIALTFKNISKAEDCGQSFIVSDEGYSISEKSWENMKILSEERKNKNRKKRQTNYKQGIVLSSQLAAQLTAVTMHNYIELKTIILALSRIQCQRNPISSDEEATRLIRKSANNQLLKGKLVGDIIMFWPCIWKNFTFRSTKGECYERIPVQIENGEKGFLDPKTGIIENESRSGACEQIIRLGEEIVKIYQPTGKISKIAIGKVNIEQELDLPKIVLHYFNNLPIVNSTDEGLEIIKELKEFKRFNQLKDENNFGEKIENEKEYELKKWQIGISDFFCFDLAVRITVVLIWIVAGFHLYNRYTEYKVKRAMGKVIEKNIRKGQVKRWFKIRKGKENVDRKKCTLKDNNNKSLLESQRAPMPANSTTQRAETLPARIRIELESPVDDGLRQQDSMDEAGSESSSSSGEKVAENTFLASECRLCYRGEAEIECPEEEE